MTRIFRNSMFFGIAVLAGVLLVPSESQAQVTVIGVTPPGPIVVGPPVVVPPPPVIMVEPGPVPPPRCVHRRCVRRRRPCRRRRTVRRPVAPAPVPRDLRIEEELPKWSLGVGLISTSYSDGGLMGSNLFLRYALDPSMEIEGYVGGMDSCTACYQNAERHDNVAGINVYMYNSGRKAVGVSTYVKGGVYSQTFSYTFKDYPEDYFASRTSSEYSQVGLQGGVGFQWKLTEWIGVNMEGLLQVPVAGDETEYGETDDGNNVMNETLGKGVPTGELGKVGFGFNVSLSVHF